MGNNGNFYIQLERKQPLIIIAGTNYGQGSSRDWAKGVRLAGVGSFIAESIERIHRTNLVGMGVLPLQFKDEIETRFYLCYRMEAKYLTLRVKLLKM